MLYAWEILDRLDQEHIAHLVFLFEDGGPAAPEPSVYDRGRTAISDRGLSKRPLS